MDTCWIHCEVWPACEKNWPPQVGTFTAYSNVGCGLHVLNMSSAGEPLHWIKYDIISNDCTCKNLYSTGGHLLNIMLVWPACAKSCPLCNKCALSHWIEFKMWPACANNCPPLVGTFTGWKVSYYPACPKNCSLQVGTFTAGRWAMTWLCKELSSTDGHLHWVDSYSCDLPVQGTVHRRCSVYLHWIKCEVWPAKNCPPQVDTFTE